MPTELPPRPFDSPRPIDPSAAVAIPSFLARVYVWMAAGLLVTAGAAFATLSNESLLKLVFGNRMVFFGLMIGELALVAWLSGLVGRLSSGAAGAVFLFYSALNGLTLSVVFLAYTSASVVSTFVVTAGMFGAMSVYGLVTKRALDGLGSFAFMGLIGVILASVVNIFLRNDMLGFVVSCVGVIVFTALTAYDTRKLKMMAATVDGASEEGKRGAISGALALYLDFINLFLMLLRLFGNRR
ncbi:MAG TPA: Bax inhibitor-1/YccA family protein [Thermoanaerobaculia bacterium]|nr:Bax inhibitor-1/YccA family protein [Thermoanaerobaculia bacterium]